MAALLVSPPAWASTPAENPSAEPAAEPPAVSAAPAASDGLPVFPVDESERIRDLEEKLDATLDYVDYLRTELETLKAERRIAPADTAIYRPDPRERTVLLTQGGAGGRSGAASDEDILAQEETSPTQEEPVLQPGVLRRARAVLIGGGRFEIEPTIGFDHRTRNNLRVRGLDLIENIFIGTIEVLEVRRTTMQASLAARLGVTDRFQFNVNVPYNWTFNTEVLNPEVQRQIGEQVETTADSRDLGDIEFGVSAHLLREGDFKYLPFDIIGTASAKSDTGNSPFATSPDEFSNGTGFWGVRGGLTLVKVMDPGVLFGNVGYFYHIPSDSNVGDFDEVDPPDDIFWSAGFSWSMNPSLSLFTRFSNRFIEKTKINGFEIDGSDGVSAIFTTGATVRTSRISSMDFSVGFGLTDDSPDFLVRVSMPFTLTLPALEGLFDW